MAKQETKLKHFFEGKRRECELRDFHVLKDRQDVKRIKLSIVMPLSNRPATGMPEDFAEQFFLMDKEMCSTNASKIAVSMDGATAEIFSTDTVKGAAITSIGAVLQDFKMVGVGLKEKRTVSLEFTMTAMHTVKLLDWADKHLHATFYIEALPSQMELPTEEEPSKKPKKGKQTNFDPEEIQKAAKKGELIQ